MRYKPNILSGSYLEAGGNLIVGKNFTMGKNVRVRVRGNLYIGNYSRFGDDVDITAESLSIGDHFFHHTSGLRIGGGGSHTVFASMTIGDRCVMHNNYINLAAEVVIGDDVGVCPDVDFLTHGFWNSPLEGFPYAYKPITVMSGVIIGQRSLLMPVVVVVKDVVIGANSTVTKSLKQPRSVYAGTPAKFLRHIQPLSLAEKEELAGRLVRIYRGGNITLTYPHVYCNNAVLDLEQKTIKGIEDHETDNLRDHLRRCGIKIYTSRPFGLAP